MKPATQINVEYRRIAIRTGTALLLFGALAACSGGDYAPAAEVGRHAAPAAHTGTDGYPNINVDTAGPLRTPVRTAEERDRLEAELMALGARQRSTAGDGGTRSVVQELEELGRRSKEEAARQIESGRPPAQP